MKEIKLSEYKKINELPLYKDNPLKVKIKAIYKSGEVSNTNMNLGQLRDWFRDLTISDNCLRFDMESKSEESPFTLNITFDHECDALTFDTWLESHGLLFAKQVNHVVETYNKLRDYKYTIRGPINGLHFASLMIGDVPNDVTPEDTHGLIGKNINKIVPIECPTECNAYFKSH